MAKKGKARNAATVQQTSEPVHPGKPSALLDTRVIYCGDNLEQLKKLPDDCIDLIYIEPPFSSSLSLRAEGNSNRNDGVFWGETSKRMRAGANPSCDRAVLPRRGLPNPA